MVVEQSEGCGMKDENGFSEIILASVVPVLAYAFAYFFECGYLTVFDVPTFLITVSIERFFFAFAKIIAFILIFVGVSDFILSLFSDISSRYIRLFWFMAVLPLFPCYAVYEFFYGQLSFELSVIAVICLLALFFVYAIPWFETRNVKDWIVALEEVNQRERERNTNSLSSRIVSKIGYGNYVCLIACLVVLPVFSIYWGVREAKLQDVFFSAHINGLEYALIRVYGDDAVLVGVEREWRTLYEYDFKFQSHFILVDPNRDGIVFSEAKLYRNT